MFTIKYRSWEVCDRQPTPAPASPCYSQLERLDGPFAAVSTRYENGLLAVSCDRNDMTPGMTYGPVQPTEGNVPRPTLWVMNEQGATIAKYDL